tara:strand:+ start:138 stop:512 length:375 start_codon:yes stop_codon:yes gene_type:complete
MTEDVVIPVALFGSIFGIVWLVSHFNFKKRQTLHDTIRHAVDRGQELSAEMMDKLSLITDPVRADLRRGVLFIAFGLAFFVLGMLVSSEEAEAMKPMLGVASFPIFLGLAYLGLWKFGRGSRSA